MSQAEQQTGSRTKLDVEVRKATNADAPALTEALARAFDDDPLVNWMCAQDERRTQRVHAAMDLSLRKLGMPHGEVYTTGQIHGGSLWAPPGKWKMGILQQILLTPQMIRITSLRRMNTVMGGINALEKKHPAVPHFYLFVLGVDTQYQGQSIGTQLMRPVLERCDREGIPAYLESSKEKNVPLYERNGFKVTEEYNVPNGGPKIWLMWRDPT
jgi:N-acetylglutamate synthase-like GNAT family acetyltransferase